MKTTNCLLTLFTCLFAVFGLAAHTKAYYEVSTTVPSGSVNISGVNRGCFSSCTMSFQNSSSSDVVINSSDGWSKVMSAGATESHTFTSSATLTSTNGFSGSANVYVTPGVQAGATTSTTANLSWGSWQGPGSAAKYLVYYQITTSYNGACPPYSGDGYYGGGWVFPKETTGTEITLTNLGSDLPYCAYVAAYTNGSMGIAGSNLVPFRTKAAEEVTSEPQSTSTTKTTSTSSTTNKTGTSTSTSTGNTVTQTDPAIVIDGTTKDLAQDGSWIVTENILHLSGQAKPNSQILLTVHSDPVTQQATVDNNGAWAVDINLDNLAGGQHLITAQYLVDGATTAAVDLVTFEYQPRVEATLVNETESPSNHSALYYSLLGIVLVILAVTIAVRRRKNKKGAGPTNTKPKNDSTPDLPPQQPEPPISNP